MVLCSLVMQYVIFVSWSGPELKEYLGLEVKLRNWTRVVYARPSFEEGLPTKRQCLFFLNNQALSSLSNAHLGSEMHHLAGPIF